MAKHNTYYKSLITNLNNIKLDDETESFGLFIENVSKDIDTWFEKERELCSKIGNIPNLFHQNLRTINLDTLFTIEHRQDFIKFFSMREDFGNVNRFFKLIEYIYIKYPTVHTSLAIRKFLMTVSMKETMSENKNTVKEVEELIDGGCYWIWILPLYQYTLMYKSNS